MHTRDASTCSRATRCSTSVRARESRLRFHRNREETRYDVMPALNELENGQFETRRQPAGDHPAGPHQTVGEGPVEGGEHVLDVKVFFCGGDPARQQHDGQGVRRQPEQERTDHADLVEEPREAPSRAVRVPERTSRRAVAEEKAMRSTFEGRETLLESRTASSWPPESSSSCTKVVFSVRRRLPDHREGAPPKRPETVITSPSARSGRSVSGGPYMVQISCSTVASTHKLAKEQPPNQYNSTSCALTSVERGRSQTRLARVGRVDSPNASTRFSLGTSSSSSSSRARPTGRRWRR